MEGIILGNRYELIKKIGGGGMALVYKAKCNLLNRYVAVKILRSEFVNDNEFVKRFRIEAQSAASLSHPNIVSIYDVGQEDDIYYIVMEYINGNTLKDYIIENGKLSWREAMSLSIQVCSAIEHAHKNNIIHRDIKPHNILLTKDGIAKVTDFGIARAVTSTTITMAGSTIGSVHYFSPEQARGGYTDVKSDLYSLGIMLYEMVTGQLPFDADTAVGVAMKHIQTEAKQPIDLDNTLPLNVNKVIMKSIEKDQLKRYESAEKMLQDLNKIMENPYTEFDETKKLDDFSTKRIEIIGDEELIKKSNEQKNQKNQKKKKNKVASMIALIISLAIIVSVGVAFNKVVMPWLGPIVFPDQETNTLIQKYVGRNIEEVKAELDQKEIKYDIKEVFSDSFEEGLIVSQDPTEGSDVKIGKYTKFIFEVSKGMDKIPLSDYKWKEYRDVESRLKQLDLDVEVMDEHSEEVGSGYVIRTYPKAGTNVDKGSQIIIYKSIGPEIKLAKIPNVVGMTESEAKTALLESNLVLGKIYPEDVSGYTGTIVKQEPAAFTEVDEGTPVDIYFNVVTETVIDEIDINKEPSISNYSHESIKLNNPNKYDDQIRVHVFITPSDTGRTKIFIDDVKMKSDFPLDLLIPVPENGSTEVEVRLDNILYRKFTTYISRR